MGTTVGAGTEKDKAMQEKETLDERLPGLFEPDTLLPIQYFEAMRRKHLLEGEKRLILGLRNWKERKLAVMAQQIQQAQDQQARAYRIERPAQHVAESEAVKPRTRLRKRA